MSVCLLAACAVALGASLVAGNTLRSLSTRRVGDPEAVLRQLAQARSAFAASPDVKQGGRAAELVREVLSEARGDAPVATLNEELGRLEYELGRGRAIAAACVRISLATGTCAAVLELARVLTHPVPDPRYAIAAFGVGVVGALTAGALARLALRRAQDIALAYDRLAGRLGVLLAGPIDGASGDLEDGASAHGSEGMRAGLTAEEQLISRGKGSARLGAGRRLSHSSQ